MGPTYYDSALICCTNNTSFQILWFTLLHAIDRHYLSVEVRNVFSFNEISSLQIHDDHVVDEYTRYMK